MAIDDNWMEARPFHFFCQRTLPQLTGFFGDDLWDYLILRASHYEPAIRHAVIALGSLHERFINHNGMVSKSTPEFYHNNFALQEYTAAIKSLVLSIASQKQQPLDLCIIVCIIFACFESMQGCYGQAIAHIDSGSKILLELQTDDMAKSRTHDVFKSSSIPYAPINVIEGIFMRLKRQVLELVGGSKWLIAPESIVLHRYTPFTNIADARQFLVWNWHYTIATATLEEQPESDNVQEVEASLQEWKDQGLVRLKTNGMQSLTCFSKLVVLASLTRRRKALKSSGCTDYLLGQH